MPQIAWRASTRLRRVLPYQEIVRKAHPSDPRETHHENFAIRVCDALANRASRHARQARGNHPAKQNLPACGVRKSPSCVWLELASSFDRLAAREDRSPRVIEILAARRDPRQL